MEKEFVCDKCGLCCRNLQLSCLYDDLNRGDGICKHLDLATNLCRIYTQRPIKCNVNMGYMLFKDSMTIEEYYINNYEFCKWLKRKSREL